MDSSDSIDNPEPSSSGNAQVAVLGLNKEDVETENSHAPSDWTVYSYFLRSCGLAGISLFFVLAAVLAAERSFESELKAL
jgi:hypothetical protein